MPEWPLPLARLLLTPPQLVVARSLACCAEVNLAACTEPLIFPTAQVAERQTGAVPHHLQWTAALWHGLLAARSCTLPASAAGGRLMPATCVPCVAFAGCLVHVVCALCIQHQACMAGCRTTSKGGMLCSRPASRSEVWLPVQASHAAVWAAMLLLGLGAAGGFVPITPAVLKAAQIKVLDPDCSQPLFMCPGMCTSTLTFRSTLCGGNVLAVCCDTFDF